MRIISGKYRGQTLFLPSLKTTRPMRDSVKEALFSMLQFNLESSVILDAFAGSGSLALEALSRGAAKVIAIEKEAQVFKTLTQNVNKLKVENIDCFQEDILSYLNRINHLKFDLIFLDPPFKETTLLNQVLKIIVLKNLLKNQGLIVVQTNLIDSLKLPPKLIVQKNKKYRHSYIWLLANIL